MSRNEIIEKTVNAISKLPDDKAEEIADFADFVLKKFDGANLQKGVEYIMSNSKTFEFLNEDEDIYSLDDLKEKY